MDALYQLSYRGRSKINLVLEVGLEPTKPKGGRFTVSCDCHYTIPASNLEPLYGFEP